MRNLAAEGTYNLETRTIGFLIFLMLAIPVFVCWYVAELKRSVRDGLAAQSRLDRAITARNYVLLGAGTLVVIGLFFAALVNTSG